MMTTYGNDLSFVAISWTATGAFALLANRRVWFRRHRLPRALLAFVVACALCAFAVATRTAPWRIPALLWRRVFDGTYVRLCLLLFWLLCSCASLLFIVLVRHRLSVHHQQRHSSVARVGTGHRKFFHLTASLVTVSGLLHDPPFLAFCVHFVLQIFIIVEVLRSQRVQPFCWLDDCLLMFIDGQDSPELIMTPILLLVGLNLPILFDLRLLMAQNAAVCWTLRQWHFAGVISVGVGDSAAALIGSKFGRIRWPSLFDIADDGTALQQQPLLIDAAAEGVTANGQPHGSQQHRRAAKNAKTVEGSMAMFITQIVVAEGLLLFNSTGFSTRPWLNDGVCCSVSSAVPLVAAAFIATLVEAQLPRFDNVLVPLCSMLTFWLLEWLI
uniref:dolichol kinase n=1 Tax=Globodera rostochiensis TaxID=31243 RepID=A0A914I2D8_GLORO